MKILSTQELLNKKYPSRKQITHVYETSQTIVQSMVQNKELHGATSYGSVAKENFGINSDIDWIFVFENYQKIIDSQDFRKIINLHQEFHVDFHPPITTLTLLATSFHNIMLFNQIKDYQSRFVVGVDPLESYQKFSKPAAQLKAMEVCFQNFNKEHMEPIFYHINYGSNFDEYLLCLQNIISASMEITRNITTTLTYGQTVGEIQTSKRNYQDFYPKYISVSMLGFQSELAQFKTEYRSYLDQITSSPINMLQIKHYKDFLRSKEHYINQGLQFCIENLNLYQNHLSISLNL